MAAILFGTHSTGGVEGTGVEQQFFGERGFAGIGMRNDGERASALDFGIKANVGRNRGRGCGLWWIY